MVSTPNSTNGQISLLDGTDDPGLRSLFKYLKITLTGRLAKPQSDDCNGQHAPDDSDLARKRLGEFREMTGAGQCALPRCDTQLGTNRRCVRFMSA